MIKNKFLTYGIFALILIGIIFVIGCVQQLLNQTPELSLSYHYTAEVSYFDVKIDGSDIAYTHIDSEKIKDRCAQWLQQSPCWTQQDLIIEEVQLTNQEITDLKNIIEETKIMQLENYYGPEQGARCYPYTLKIDGKEIVYCSRPDGPSRPEAFSKVAGKIQEIVTQKFSK
jgi:hypothetical protein